MKVLEGGQSIRHTQDMFSQKAFSVAEIGKSTLSFCRSSLEHSSHCQLDFMGYLQKTEYKKNVEEIHLLWPFEVLK